jgi:hypothetical protein
MFELAQHLGQPLSVILDMTAMEYEYWSTFRKVHSRWQSEILEKAKEGKHGKNT